MSFTIWVVTREQSRPFWDGIFFISELPG